jgi:hypothetical protein
MVIFKKKEVKDNSSDLPELPKIENISDKFDSDSQEDDYGGSISDSEDYHPNTLPSFPGSNMGDKFSKAIVKSAVSSIPENKNETVLSSLTAGPAPDFSQSFRPQTRPKPMPQYTPEHMREPEELHEMESSPLPIAPIVNQPPMSYKPKMYNTPSNQFSAPKPSQKTAAEPVYVRIDKYKAALNSFHEVQIKISEIDHLLNQIRDQKKKEEEELIEWEREIEIIKERIAAIDQGIFSQLD